MNLAQIKAKIAALTRRQKILVGLIAGGIFLVLISLNLTKTFPKNPSPGPSSAISPLPAVSPTQQSKEDWQYPGYRLVDQSEEFLTIVRQSLVEAPGKGRGFTQLESCTKRQNFFPPDLAAIELEKIGNWYGQQAQKYGWQFSEGNYPTPETPRLYTKDNQKLYVTIFVYAQSPAIDLCWK